MKKLKVKKGSTCMACLACVRACSESFYKEFDPDKSGIQMYCLRHLCKSMSDGCTGSC